MQGPVLAVVDATGDQIIVWGVDLGAKSPQASRMCGAWVIAADETNKLQLLVAGRLVVTTLAGAAALYAAEITVAGRLDVAATLVAANEALDAVQAAFEAEQAVRPKSKKMADVRWPTLPEALDVDNPALIDAPPNVRRALSVARWLAVLARGWEDAEAKRTAHAQLQALGGQEARCLPLVLVQPEAAGAPSLRTVR